jgi:hypothetical protein
MSVQPSAFVMCRFCGWRASLIGDSYLEIITFLRARMVEHVESAHPERVPQHTDGVIFPTEVLHV